MRIIGGFFLAALLFAGFLTRPGGGIASSGRSGEISRQVDATPAEVMAVVRDALVADGLEIVSRSDDGYRLRQVIPSTVLARDPEFASLSRFGDMIVSARVGRDEAEVTTGFALVTTSANYRITAEPGRNGKGTLVRVEPIIEEGTGRDSRRLARGLRTVIDRSGRDILEQLTAAAG